MAAKTIKKAIADALEDLSPENFNKFRHALRDRRKEPRVRRNKVDGKDYLDITDVLISTFTEEDALEVAVELLRDIGCNEEAAGLVKDAGGLSSKAGSSNIKEEGGSSSKPGPSDNEHFVDKYRRELTQRVTNIPPILDELLNKKVISEEDYEKIMALPTSQERMRALYTGCLKGGTTCKDLFYKFLQEHERYLIKDLEAGK